MIWLQNRVRYVPDVLIRTSERAGLMNIPASAAQYSFPILSVCPVGKSQDAVQKRIRDIKDDKWESIGIDVAGRTNPNPERPEERVHIFLSALKHPNNDFENWRGFISENAAYVPVLQLDLSGEVENFGLTRQLNDFVSLGRGIIFRYPMRPKADEPYGRYEDALRYTIEVLQSRQALHQLLIVLDAGRVENIELTQNWLNGRADFIDEAAGRENVCVSLSGTSFPPQFDGLEKEIPSVEIKERQLYNLSYEYVSTKVLKFIYGDYASTRGESEPGGFLGPARVDFAAENVWWYNRQRFEDREDEPEDRKVAFHLAARRIVEDDVLGPEIEALEGLYGANVILSAAANSEEAKGSAGVWTGVRINLHVFQQAMYGINMQPTVEDDFVD